MREGAAGAAPAEAACLVDRRADRDRAARCLAGTDAAAVPGTGAAHACDRDGVRAAPLSRCLSAAGRRERAGAADRFRSAALHAGGAGVVVLRRRRLADAGVLVGVVHRRRGEHQRAEPAGRDVELGPHRRAGRLLRPHAVRQGVARNRGEPCRRTAGRHLAGFCRRADLHAGCAAVRVLGCADRPVTTMYYDSGFLVGSRDSSAPSSAG